MKSLINKIRNSHLHYFTSKWLEKLECEGFTLSYSQNGEDLMLKTIFGKHKKNGCYVDVGCNNPIQKNNTFKLYLKGWRGINIDGNATLINRFNKIRKQDINLNEVISFEKKEIRFFQVKNSHELSTIEEGSYDTLIKNGYEVEEKKYVTKTLAEVLEKHLNNRRIDLLSVDVEGHDLEVLKSNDFEKFRPSVICVESNADLNNLSNSEVHNFLVSKSYVLIAFSAPNGYYKDKSN
jgi:FkbM family methyltransferase